ncbi:MAG TPA: hypothetical protein VFJ62_12595 [Usitatibacter sp.]|nr:hypothetical protein [Usitatibacter sp.]
MTSNRFCNRCAAVLLAILAGAASLASWADVNSTLVPFVTSLKGSAETVAFTGNARIDTQVILDNVLGNAPVMEIVVDMSGVSGVGASTGSSYSISGPAIIHRPLAPNDLIRVTFPFYRGSDLFGAETVEATFTCKFDTATGAVTAVKLTTLKM